MSFQDVQFAFTTPLASVFQTLEVTSIPALSVGSNSIRIRKITIVETPPPPSFTLSPTSVTKTCGTALTQIFTATGTNIPQGATVSYLWNLGSASNGWLYNSAAAPQTITTAANTLSLSAVACGISPSNNIAVTATVNGTNYSAGTITVSPATLSINGPATICSGGTPPVFSITNLGCSPTVSWSTSPLGIVNIGSPTLPTTAISYASNGTTTLTANYTSGCGSGTLTKTITAGNPVPSGVSVYYSNYGYSSTNSITSQYATLGTNTGQPGDNGATFNYTINDSRFSSFTWSPVSQPVGTNYQWASGDATMWAYVINPNTNGAVTITMQLQANGPCGVYTQNINSTAARFGYGKSVVKIHPNPAKNYVTVTADNNSASKSGVANLIYGIKITEGFGKLRKSLEYKSGISLTTISISDLKAGIYLLSVFDGRVWSSQNLVVQ